MNVDEVIAAAFQLLEEKEHEYAFWLKDTREKVEVGLPEIERGEILDTEIVIETEYIRQKSEFSLGILYDWRMNKWV